MPQVVTEVTVEAPLETVWQVARDNRSFPDFMDDVKSLEVVEEQGDRVVSDYVGIVSSFGLKVRWRQEDIWDEEAKTCAFRQLEGDYDKLEGIWTFSGDGQSCTFHSELDYEYNVPTLGPLVKKVVHNLVVKNMDGVLGAIKKRAEERASQ
jgi:ribosome-associated toxin RatA of RatAB toxin-antitoxin module